MTAADRTPRRGMRIGPEEICFEFDGRAYRAQRGDTAASALHASGVRIVNRSIKYRRPRGLLACGPEEPNALLTVGLPPRSVPNVPAPMLQVRPGMQLRSQNRWPSLHLDLASLLRLGSGFWGAGFYYKTFMWPGWRSYEPLIRRLAGLGSAPGSSDLPRAAVRHLDADLVVAGAGPAGLAAALTAARAGARVILCEREPVAGGELEFEAATLDDQPALGWVARVLAELESLGACVLLDTAVVSAAQGVVIAHHQPAGMPGADTLYRLYAPKFINAMGAVERPIAFVDNDRPGIMLTGAAERLLCRYGVHAGQRVVLFGNHDRLYSTALRLLAGGLSIELVVDTRSGTSCTVRTRVLAAGVECLLGAAVVAAHGNPELRSATIAHVGETSVRREAGCDALLVSGGWSPAVAPAMQYGGVTRYAGNIGGFVAAGQPAWQSARGAAAGTLQLARVLEGTARVAGDDGPPGIETFWRSTAVLADEKRQFVDLQNDVTVADLRQSLDEGFADIEHVKRYTTLGTGTEQGRTGGVLGAAILAELGGAALAAVGTSRARGPYQPVPMGVLAGRRVGLELRPERRTSLHGIHLAAGAELELMSGWMRPRYYRSNGADAFAAGVTEAARVRTHGGICDASTLGKIEIAGPDAAAFLERLYVNPAASLEVGRTRYAVLLREDGMVLDDGLLMRLGVERFVATTSSSHLPQVLAHAEFYRDTEFAGRRVALTDVTEGWSVIVAAGPASRDALARVLGADWTAEMSGMRHMNVTERGAPGARLRVLRASFSGELAYEVHCQPALAGSLWNALAAAGLRPFGLEALDILRVEKGYLASSELNGQTTPADVGQGALLRGGRDCVGKAMLERPAFADPQRPILVGLHAVDGASKFLAGAQITATPAAKQSLGHVTSSVWSPALRQWIGLALVARTSSALGTELIARDPLRDGNTAVRVVPTAHFDPSGARMKA